MTAPASGLRLCPRRTRAPSHSGNSTRAENTKNSASRETPALRATRGCTRSQSTRLRGRLPGARHVEAAAAVPFPSIECTKSPRYVLLFNFSSRLKLLTLTISSTSERSSCSSYLLLPMGRCKTQSTRGGKSGVGGEGDATSGRGTKFAKPPPVRAPAAYSTFSIS